MRLGTYSGGVAMQTSQGIWGMLPREILKLRSFEIAGNLFFPIHFLHFQCFQGGQPSYTKSVPSPVPTSMAVRVLAMEVAILSSELTILLLSVTELLFTHRITPPPPQTGPPKKRYELS